MNRKGQLRKSETFSDYGQKLAFRGVPLLFLLVFGLVTAFSQARTYDFPHPVDTKTKETYLQERQVTEISETLFADNTFKGARLNSIYQANDTLIVAGIEPENFPINPSPWYAFRLWTSAGSEKQTLKIEYSEDVHHRYWPNFSMDGKSWSRFDSSLVTIAADTSSVHIQLTIPMDTIWIAAQPIINSDHVKKWIKELNQNRAVKKSKAGKSTGNRTIPFIQMTQGSPKNKDVIVCLSRQHPPEVTGFLALQSFLEKILDGSQLSNEFLDKYVVLVYPLINPDGVDEGHWRHGLGGIDLNRDWAYYHQPEIRIVADHVIKKVNKSKGRVILGLDFHSTYYDIYYTTDRELAVINGDFTDQWLEYIKAQIPDYDPKDAPSGIGRPTSKGWFNTQFNANGITYEIGDNTPPEFIKKKSEVSAVGMMNILLNDPPK